MKVRCVDIESVERISWNKCSENSLTQIRCDN